MWSQVSSSVLQCRPSCASPDHETKKRTLAGWSLSSLIKKREIVSHHPKCQDPESEDEIVESGSAECETEIRDF